MEIMCSVPGNLAPLPSFHLERLESTSLTALHRQAFLNILSCDCALSKFNRAQSENISE